MKTEKASGRWQTLVVTGAAGVSALLGLVVLVGWYTHSVILVQVSPAFVPMQYNTALGFLLSGVGLLLLVYGRPHLAMTCGAVAAAIGLLTLTEYILGIDLGIDQLLMEHYITVRTSHPGRMGPNTALCFTLAGAALLISSGRTRPRQRSLISGLLGSITGILGLVPLFGYTAGIPSAYGWGQLTRMAVHTATGFVVFGVGVIAFAWRESETQEPGPPRWLAIAVAIGGVTLAGALWQALVAQQRAAAVHSFLPEAAFTTGLLMGLLLTLTVHLAQTARLRAKEVESANRHLQAHIAERKRAEETREALYLASLKTQEPLSLNERLAHQGGTSALPAA